MCVGLRWREKETAASGFSGNLNTYFVNRKTQPQIHCNPILGKFTWFECVRPKRSFTEILFDFYERLRQKKRALRLAVVAPTGRGSVSCSIAIPSSNLRWALGRSLFVTKAERLQTTWFSMKSPLNHVARNRPLRGLANVYYLVWLPLNHNMRFANPHSRKRTIQKNPQNLYLSLQGDQIALNLIYLQI